MNDPFASNREETTILPAQKIRGTVAGVFKAEGASFVSTAVEELQLDFGGVPGDFHAGQTRKSTSREPWYPRGTEIRNERQLSLIAPDEMKLIAQRLEIPKIKPEWIGANLLLEGIDNFTMLPPRTLLFFEGGVTIKIDGDNGPCRIAGRSIAGHFEGREDIETGFSKHGQHLRGLVGWVEKPGSILLGEEFEARIPPQWIYEKL